MELIITKKDLAKYKGKQIGFVPTMGYLHEGHLSLIRAARKENRLVIVSIFVNPTQFGENEDLTTYPKDLKRDLELCKKENVDIVFAPSIKELYPEGEKRTVEANPDLKTKMCGKSRPIHFDGVATVVHKLFELIEPTRAYFGQKDYQQFLIIKCMAQHYFPVMEIVMCPIVREKDGLAMSSRNEYLTEEEREQASVLNESLELAKKMIKEGEIKADNIKKAITEKINTKPLADVDYIALADADTLEDTKIIKGKIVIALAVKFGKARLIDNMLINTSEMRS